MTDSHKSNSAERNTSGSGSGESPLPRVQTPSLIALAISLLMLLAGAVLAWSWRHSLPDPIAVHWSASGQPDGFSSIGGFIWPLVGIMGVSIFLIAAIGFAAQSSSSITTRTVDGTVVFMGALSLFITVFTVGPQRGLENAQDASLSSGALAATLAGSALIGVVAALLRPRPRRAANAAARPATDAIRARIPAGESFYWTGKTSIRPLGFGIGVGLMLLVFGMIGVGTQTWLPFLISLPVVALAVLMSVFTVTIDPAGLFVRAWLGWPKKRIEAVQINDARVVTIHPFQEFGGWGYRAQLGGAEGIVLRKGPGIKVRYGNDQELYITLNSGADQAAALLNTAADWAQDAEQS